MDVKNPLEIVNTPSKISTKPSNNAGRPTKSKEIKFTSPPESMISLLLKSEKSKKDSVKNVLQKGISETAEATPDVIEIKVNTKDESDHHKDLHTSKFSCQNCTYTTTSSSNLIKHVRIHTSEKPYACDRCIFRTNFQNSLKVHQRIHTSERPYKCKNCDYSCNSSSNLKKHCKHRHLKQGNNEQKEML